MNYFMFNLWFLYSQLLFFRMFAHYVFVQLVLSECSTLNLPFLNCILCFFQGHFEACLLPVRCLQHCSAYFHLKGFFCYISSQESNGNRIRTIHLSKRNSIKVLLVYEITQRNLGKITLWIVFQLVFWSAYNICTWTIVRCLIMNTLCETVSKSLIKAMTVILQGISYSHRQFYLLTILRKKYFL